MRSTTYHYSVLFFCSLPLSLSLSPRLWRGHGGEDDGDYSGVGAGKLFAAGVEMSEGAVYKVGDASGWTITGSPNYTAWALSKKFEVGDTILFEYNKNFHDVLEVNQANYNACNTTSPIAIHTSGNDSITITSKVHRYFICGFPGHCSAGQKVDIKVSESSSAAPSSSPTASPPSSGSSTGGIPTTPAGAPKPSGGTRAIPSGVVLVLAVFSLSTAVSGGLFRL